MQIHLWGIDFRRGNQAIRSKLYLPPEDRAQSLRQFLTTVFSDLLYVHTCNRIEFYTTVSDPFEDTRKRWIQLLNQISGEGNAFYQGYYLEGKSAFRHLLRVASSLESMVIGEPQILGQLKEALRWTKEQGMPVSAHLERCFQIAFQTAKKIRTETEIGERPTSIAALGLQRLQALENEIPLERAAIVGRGEMAILVMRWLKKNRPQCPIWWINRSVERLKDLPEAAGVELLSLDSFKKNPPSFSHLITATASSEFIFDRLFFEKSENRPKVAIDFAEPPDVEPETTSTMVKIIHTQDLASEAKKNERHRSKAIERSETILEEVLRSYYLQEKETPVLKEFNEVEPLFMRELQSALGNFRQPLPEALRPELTEWAQKLVKRNLHHSRKHLRSVIRQAALKNTCCSRPI